MQVLVTGAGGYRGCLLAPLLPDVETFPGRGHTRQHIEYLLKSGQVDEQLFWRGTW